MYNHENEPKPVPDDAQSHAAMDTSNNPEFFSYYEEQSSRPYVVERCRYLKDVLLSFYALQSNTHSVGKLNVLDVGCGAGTQSILWAEAGHAVYGVDVSAQLIEVARERMAKAGVAVEFKVGTATALPLPSAEMDICLMPELLEHVPDWKKTLEECARVLKPGGMLYVSTVNALCPLQEEFTLPLYSWYPGFVKRFCEKKSVTTHRHWVNYATYPAVNWFTTPSLSKELERMGFRCYDRFDIMNLTNKPSWLVFVIRHFILPFRLFRYFAYVLNKSTLIVAIKEHGG